MGIEQKTKSRFSSYNVMLGFSRVFRALGWFGFWGTLGYAMPYFVSEYSDRLNSRWYADSALQWTIGNTFTLIVFGLVMAACAFLMSVALDTGLMLLVQRRTQIALLERLVRERREKLDPISAVILTETL